VQAIVTYNKTLTAAQVSQLTSAMAAL